jgi:hypothetical protein
MWYCGSGVGTTKRRSNKMPQVPHGKILAIRQEDAVEVKMPTNGETDWVRICFGKGHEVWMNSEQFKSLMADGVEILPQLTFENKDVES